MYVIQRGNNRERCFNADDDYQRYKQDLLEAAQKNQVAIHAYVLLTNHVAAPLHPCNRGT